MNWYLSVDRFIKLFRVIPCHSAIWKLVKMMLFIYSKSIRCNRNYFSFLKISNNMGSNVDDWNICCLLCYKQTICRFTVWWQNCVQSRSKFKRHNYNIETRGGTYDLIEAWEKLWTKHRCLSYFSSCRQTICSDNVCWQQISNLPATFHAICIHLSLIPADLSWYFVVHK